MFQVHQLTHAGIKRYTCPVCGRRYITSSRLTTHLRSHSEEKHYGSVITPHCMLPILVHQQALLWQFWVSSQQISTKFHIEDELGNTVFTMQCDAVLVRYMPLSCVRLSVHLSVTSRCSAETAKCRIMQAMLHDSPGILVFCCQRSRQNSCGVTSNGGFKCRLGRLKSTTFDKLLAIT